MGNTGLNHINTLPFGFPCEGEWKAVQSNSDPLKTPSGMPYVFSFLTAVYRYVTYHKQNCIFGYTVTKSYETYTKF